MGPWSSVSTPASASRCAEGKRSLRFALVYLFVVMPFKSKAQRRKFAELLVEGKIKPETYEEWNRETGSKNLPERVHRKKKKPKKKRTRKSTQHRRRS